MTAIIGFCTHSGAFLAADSRRVDIATGAAWAGPVQKIVPLTSAVSIATGGLGSIGHAARNDVITHFAGQAPSVPDIVAQARQEFRRTFAQSQAEHPGHEVPLTCVLAGQDEAGRGFIVSLGSRNDFEPFWVREPGKPYFTGSNTQLLIEVASRWIYRLKDTCPSLWLDEWAVATVDELSGLDAAVGFPLQLTLTESGRIDRMVDDVSHFARSDDFKTTFPAYL